MNRAWQHPEGAAFSTGGMGLDADTLVLPLLLGHLSYPFTPAAHHQVGLSPPACPALLPIPSPVSPHLGSFSPPCFDSENHLSALNIHCPQSPGGSQSQGLLRDGGRPPTSPAHL